MRHYDEETERRETEMINLKASLEKLVEDHIELKQTYEARKAEMEDWLIYKKLKQEKEDFQALQVWAATKIQAWWRGVMFRKKLGPYSKKKKGKDMNKGKKGKKK
ncbi:IQ domain-containing protein G-like [Anoplophora glabripennis]|uniref:IQ domain-containing protein G-like n=1 Tax=Anoplophora glabripennis TaxID=217634 RepID=UPI000873AE29|nr:IQ domain-containing protein G-like [Anoplophora glabripennis]